MVTKINIKFEEDIYKKYYPLVYSTCRRFLVKKDTLEDAIQSVFLLYIKKEDNISSNLSSWFYWASVNVCKVVNKESLKHAEKSSPLFENTALAKENSDNEELFLDLGLVLDKLPTKKRDMLLMRYYENKSYREIGSFYKSSEDSVQKMVDRTVEFLKSEINRKEILSSVVFAQFFGLNSASVANLSTNKFILQNSLLQQSFIKGVQKMYLISKLKIATILCACLLIPLAIPLSNYLFAEGDQVIVKQTQDEKTKDITIPDVATMTEAALKYLAEKQSSDGSWSDNQYKSNCGVTALCCMALMSEGSRPRVGKYGLNLEKGFEFLISNAQKNGVISGENYNQLGAMYEHIYSSMALLIAYKDLSWHPELNEIITRSLYIFTRSSKVDGGWRYDFGREGYSDMSITSNVLWFLKASKKAGFVVDDNLIKKGEDYVVKCAYPDGSFRYRYFGKATPSMDSLGIIALIKGENLEHPLLGPARDRIELDYKKSTIEDLKNRRYNLYGCFYASVGMYAFGEKYWDPWFLKATQVMKSMQKSGGEFQDEFENTMYSTAFAAIILQAPNGKLPIYERGELSEIKEPTVKLKIENKE